MPRFCFSVATALALPAALSAQAAFPSLSISIGVRETAPGSISYRLPPGGPGGTTGPIEWIDLDGQVLVLDGSWQMFTFRMGLDPVTGFTGDGVLDGAWGTLEHIRIKNDFGVTSPIELQIDEVRNYAIPFSSPPPAPYPLSEFEGYPAGNEVLFRHPGYSGTTSANLVNAGTAGVTDRLAHSGLASYEVNFQFVDGMTSRWVRLTTNRARITPDPSIVFAPQAASEVRFWMRGVACEPNAVATSTTCPGAPGPNMGPTLAFSGSAGLGDVLSLTVGNTAPGGVCSMLIGLELDPGLDLSILGAPAGALYCVTPFATVPCSAGTTLNLPIGMGPGICGLDFAAQALEIDNAIMASVPIATSAAVVFTPGS